MTTKRLTDAEVDRLLTENLPGLESKFGSGPVRCQCTNHGKTGCRNDASVILLIHCLHQCNGVDADSDGNRTELQCMGCAQGEWVWAHEQVAQLRAAAARVGIQPMCVTCQKPILTPRDLVPHAAMVVGGIR